MDAKRLVPGIWSYVKRNHLGLLALFVALGGTAYAAHGTVEPKNSVITKSIKKAAVTNPKLAPNAVDGSKVLDGSLTGADINLGSLGPVPSATSAAHATRADEATKAGEAAKAAQAANSDQLGGSPASAYVRGADSIPGGQLTGTYAAPTLSGSGSGTAGPSTLFAPVACGSGSVIGPSVTIDVPESGFVEYLASAQFQTVGGNSLTACVVEDGGSPVQVMSSSSLSAETRYSVPGSTVGVASPSLTQWTPLITTPGAHTFKLEFGRTGANSGTNQVSNRLLLVRALS